MYKIEERIHSCLQGLLSAFRSPICAFHPLSMLFSSPPVIPRFYATTQPSLNWHHRPSLWYVVDHAVPSLWQVSSVQLCELSLKDLLQLQIPKNTKK